MADVVGIVVGTLSVSKYGTVIKKLSQAIRDAGRQVRQCITYCTPGTAVLVVMIVVVVGVRRQW